jgi:decaprenylphospho-beta-D-erythro-pentofuranosid-2-ulose 2-reductase
VTADRPSILLVGGSSQIGVAIVEAVTGSSGGEVVLAGRPAPALEAAADRLRAANSTVTSMAYDADWPAKRAADLLLAAEAAVGRLDLVVVAVGVLQTRGPADLPIVAEPDLATLLQTNLVGPALIANEAARLLSDQQHGRLVVVTSASAARPRGQILGYSVAKQALDSFVRGLDRRTRPHGVRCLVVRPGQVRTRMTAGLPDAPLTTGPERVGLRVRRALTRRSAVVWSPGAMGPLTTLLRMTPSWVLPEELK